jgi:nucleoside-diphosphate-sugar epimerase
LPRPRRETEIEKLPGRVVDVPRVRLDVSKIREALGWEPRTSIEEGLQKTVEWVRTLAD